MAKRVVAENHFQKEHILKDIFRVYEQLLPMSMKEPQNLFSTLDAYSTTSFNSILKLTELSVQLYADAVEEKVGEGKPKLNVSDVSSVLCLVFDHFREVGRKVDFSSNMTLWSIIQYVKQSGVLLYNLRSWNLVSPEDKRELEDLIDRFSVVVGWFFGKGKRNDHRNVVEASDAVTYLGLLAMKEGLDKPRNSCFRTITFLFEAIYTQEKNPYLRGDVLVGLWTMRVYAEHLGMKAFVEEIDSYLRAPIAEIKDEELEEVWEGLENRKGHLEDHLNEPDSPYRLSDNAEDLLKSLLNEVKERASNPSRVEPGDS